MKELFLCVVPTSNPPVLGDSRAPEDLQMSCSAATTLRVPRAVVGVVPSLCLCCTSCSALR